MKIVADRERRPAFEPITVEITVENAAEQQALLDMSCLDVSIPELVATNSGAEYNHTFLIVQNFLSALNEALGNV